jgi:hypothetical protein
VAIKETTEPTKICPNTNLVSVVNSSGNFTTEAPKITGKDRRKAKSEATE